MISDVLSETIGKLESYLAPEWEGVYPPGSSSRLRIVAMVVEMQSLLSSLDAPLKEPVAEPDPEFAFMRRIIAALDEVQPRRSDAISFLLIAAFGQAREEYPEDPIGLLHACINNIDQLVGVRDMSAKDGPS